MDNQGLPDFWESLTAWPTRESISRRKRAWGVEGNAKQSKSWDAGKRWYMFLLGMQEYCERKEI